MGFVRCVFICTRCTHVCVAWHFTLKVEAWRLQLDKGLGRPWALQTLLFLSSSLSFGPQLLDPMLLLLGQMLYTLRIKTITSIQHRVEKVGGTGGGGGEADGCTKPTKQNKPH